MGALYAKRLKCNDAFILNQNKNLSDSTIANLFLIKDDVLYTPLLSEGPVAGIIRDFVIKELRKAGYEIREEIITEQMLMEADEVFLTNSIYNIRWVAEIENKSYQNRKTLEIFYRLSKTNPSIFC
jgi:branched-chain amino acid aminotransferase